MNPTTRILAACASALAISWLSPTCASAQDPPAPAPAAAPAAAPAKPAKLTEWPKLTDADRDRVPNIVGQFRKPDPALHEAAQKQLTALGAGAVPFVLKHVSDRADNTNADIFTWFDTALAPEHAALMARELKKTGVELRRYLTIRLCRFADPDLLPVLKATMADKDESTAFHAALGALALKDKDALAPVMAFAKSRWTECSKVIGEVLPAARDRDLANHVFETIAKASVTDQMTGLRLLRSIAVKGQASTVRPYLNASDNAVKREAVNVMRVLHGEPAVENMPVFQVIEQANAWLKKV